LRYNADEKLTLTVPQAARVLGISRGLAYQMARQGTIPTLRFGRRLVVPRKAIEQLLERSPEVDLNHPTKEKHNPAGRLNSGMTFAQQNLRPEKQLWLDD
jgi:excisionase family DNA binding protein